MKNRYISLLEAEEELLDPFQYTWLNKMLRISAMRLELWKVNSTTPLYSFPTLGMHSQFIKPEPCIHFSFFFANLTHDGY